MKIGFLEIRWTDILDIFLVAVLLYNIYKLVRGSIASRVFIGYMLVYFSYLIVRAMGLELMTKILEYFMGVGAIALIVLFQQEIRRFLLLIGKSTNSRFLNKIVNNSAIDETKYPLAAVSEAAKSMSNEFTGCLMVIQKGDDLRKYTESGDAIEAILSKRLLLSIFNQYSPLHDGAVIISNGKIRAARCILPVSDGEDLPASFGFRHRAALGISEITDAAVVIVSEESGRISLALDGEIKQVVAHELEGKLKDYLLSK
jgi:diadenylate cyclase